MTNSRGDALIAGGGPASLGAGWLAHLWAGSAKRLLARFDQRVIAGRLEVTLPNGSRRIIGDHGPGIEAEITLHSWNVLIRGVSAGSVGLYKSWEAGEWESGDPVAVLALLSANSASLGQLARARGPWRMLGRIINWLRRNTRAGARRNIHAHYDLGNAFYAAWLDQDMVYSSARFDEGARDLAAAQQHKLDTIAQRVANAQTVLEIGCGWGALAQRLHERGMTVTAISLSDEQLAWAKANRPQGIEFRKQDYRDAQGQYDAIVSVEMVEAVGRAYWPDFFACLVRCLKPGGRAAIQYIALRDDLFDAYAQSADFIQTYIFPGGMLVRESEFRRLAGEHGLDWQDQVEFPIDYAETLRIWRENFSRALAAGRMPNGFDARFAQLWLFYLMYCEGGFRGGLITVAQATLTRRPE